MRAFTPVIRNQENWLLIFLGAPAAYFFSKTFSYRSGAALFSRIVSFAVAILYSSHLFGNILKTLKNQPRQDDAGAAAGCLSWYGSFLEIQLHEGILFTLFQ